MATVTLLQFWNDNKVTSLWVSGFAIPGGKTYVQNMDSESDYCDLHELIENGLSLEAAWHLEGRIQEDGSWIWLGSEDFRDANGNSYDRMQVFSSGEKL